MSGAIVGFALVFLVTVWVSSILGNAVLEATRTWQKQSGPLAERRAAEAVAIVPVVLGAIALVTLLVQSTIGVDHCEAHDHHAHLCASHGAAWLDRIWVLVVLAAAWAAAVGRIAVIGASVIRGNRSIRELHALSTVDGAVRIVESARAFCFVTRTGVYVSAHAWSSLSDGERAALVAHETAHLQQGDLRARLVLEAFLVLAAPLVGDRIRTVWLNATERLCDARAAERTGSPETVAQTMVAMCRLQATPRASAFGFTPSAWELAHRVRAVLEGGPIGERAAAIVARSVAIACCVLAVTAVVGSETIHHAFETLLG